MIRVRHAEERGHFDHGWLKTYHTFSFSDYYDPEHMHFRALRVINEDFVAPGQGFGKHPHRDMEIVTYVLEGALEHRDSLGNGSIIRPGDGQRMTAGKGIVHSEFNPSRTDTVHLLQIWIMPSTKGLKPEYEQKSFPPEDKHGRWRLIAARDGADGAVTVHQDVKLFVANLTAGDEIPYTLDAARYAWLQVARGSVELNGVALKQGDGVAVQAEPELALKATENAEVLLFDLA
ncbi:MAG TPA: pirin family protein [Clostridia bacterium]|nr:pirin family protein [Clostridia bacterium]